MSVARYWREIPQRYRYEAQKCKGCGYIAFPPRLVCPECGSRDFDKYVLQNTGKIVSFTVIEVGGGRSGDIRSGQKAGTGGIAWVRMGRVVWKGVGTGAASFLIVKPSSR